MTSREDIERLLNQTGRTLEGLPTQDEYWYSDDYVDRNEEIGMMMYRSGFKRNEPYIMHQSDVIELLVGALRDALDKPMQKPLTLEEINKFGDPVWIEFKIFSSANGWCEGVSNALYWAQRVYQDMFNPELGKAYRMWRNRPTDEEREAAVWES